MAFLCWQLQVAVETQSQTRSCWNTDRRCCRMLPPPSGHAGQNRAIVLERLRAIHGPGYWETKERKVLLQFLTRRWPPRWGTPPAWRSVASHITCAEAQNRKRIRPTARP